jgi:hypothetical protein
MAIYTEKFWVFPNIFKKFVSLLKIGILQYRL